MASNALSLLLLLLSVATSVSARPCKTIFAFSSTPTYYHPKNSIFTNPNFRMQLRKPITNYLTLISTSQLPSQSQNPLTNLNADHETIKSDHFPVRIDGSVVGVVLLRVACGVLVGAYLYFWWALFDFVYSFCIGLGRYYNYFCDDYDDVTAVKKMGYVAIPVKCSDTEFDYI